MLTTLSSPPPRRRTTVPSERTIKNIRQQAQAPGEIMRDWTYYKCDCIDHGRGRWTLCLYHLGFDDAAAAEARITTAGVDDHGR